MRTVLVVVAVWLARSVPATLLVCVLCHGSRHADTLLRH
jgi:hypothetical protein